MYWPWPLPLWSTVTLLVFFGLAIGVRALVQMARLVAQDMTAVLEMIL
jgi:hypothetical protein